MLCALATMNFQQLYVSLQLTQRPPKFTNYIKEHQIKFTITSQWIFYATIHNLHYVPNYIVVTSVASSNLGSDPDYFWWLLLQKKWPSWTNFVWTWNYFYSHIASWFINIVISSLKVYKLTCFNKRSADVDVSCDNTC